MARKEDDDFDAPDIRQPEQKSNATGMALGIAGLVVGILSLLFSFIPCVGFFALYPAIAAAALAAIGIFLSVRSKGLPTIALVISLAAVGIAFWQGERAKELAEKAAKELEEGGKQIKKGVDDLNKKNQGNP